jgi:hypothetical protein
VARAGVGRVDRRGQRVALGHHDPFARHLLERAGEALVRALDDRRDAPRVDRAPVALAAAGDLGADDVAGNRSGVLALGDEQIFVRVGRDHEAEAALVVAVRALDLVGGRLLRREHDRAARAEADAALVHEVAQRLAKRRVMLFAGKVQLVREPARLLRLVVVGLQVAEDAFLDLLGHVGDGFYGKSCG